MCLTSASPDFLFGLHLVDHEVENKSVDWFLVVLDTSYSVVVFVGDGVSEFGRVCITKQSKMLWYGKVILANDRQVRFLAFQKDKIWNALIDKSFVKLFKVSGSRYFQRSL